MFGNALPKRATRNNADEFIAARVDFKTGGALRGENRTPGQYDYTGYLRERTDDATVERFAQSSYAVWSYQTPIAWWSEADGWTIPDVSYSVTTSHHQGRAALGAYYSGDRRVNGRED